MTEPTLRAVTRSQWALLSSLYVTQYFGIGFFLTALVAIQRESGASLHTLSVVYLLGVVWALKFLWAPWVDRWKSDRLGHFRTWVIAMQTIMILCLLLIGRFHPVNDFGLIYGLCLLLSLAAATQDVATDGLAYRLVPAQDRGVVNGLQAAGGLVGNLLGAGGVLMAYPHVGWSGCTLILTAGTAVSLLQVLWFKEPVHASDAGEGANVFKRLWALVLQPGQRRWLSLILFYPLGVSMGYALITPILVDAGWTLDRIGLVGSVIGSLCGVPAALLTGRLIRRYGVRPVLIGAALLQVPGILALALPLTGATDLLPVTAAVGLYFFCYSPAATVITTLMMAACDRRSPATDYSLQYSLYMLFGIVAAALGTALAGVLGYLGVLGIAAACALAVVPMVMRHPSVEGPRPPALVAPPAHSDLLVP